jgi:hypothetical protein
MAGDRAATQLHRGNGQPAQIVRAHAVGRGEWMMAIWVSVKAI